MRTEPADLSTAEALGILEETIGEDIAMRARIKGTYEKLSEMTSEERSEFLRKEGIDSEFLANVIKVVEK